MRRGKDHRSPAQFAYESLASEDWKHNYPEWRDLTPEVQAAFEDKIMRLLLADGWIPRKTT